jgi:hypothetical protein
VAEAPAQGEHYQEELISMAHGRKRSVDGRRQMYLEDWFKVWLVTGWVWASIKAWPLGLKGLWLFLAAVPLAYVAAWGMSGGKRRPKPQSKRASQTTNDE